MRKIYFIDSENVGDNWISLLAAITAEDELLVFYTQKSPHMNYKNVILLKQSDAKIDFIECCEGNNALDFQLCTELGYRMKEISDEEFVIVSNDTGFDAVVKYWTQRNKAIRRISGKACSSASAETTVSEEVSNVSAKETETANNGIDDSAKEILYIVGKGNLQYLHEALKQLYGDKKGKTIYNAFKSDSAYNQFLSKHPAMTLKEKQHAYCSIVFSVAVPTESMPEDISVFLMESWKKKKNLNSLRSLILQKYPKEKGELYYSLFRTHIKILDKLK